MTHAMLLHSASQPECLITAAAGNVEDGEFLLGGGLRDEIFKATPDGCPGAAPAVDATQAGQSGIVQSLFQIRTVHQFGLATPLQQGV
jgi:hypothetical protein